MYQKEQDAFAAVPSRRAVRVDRLSLRAAVRALGRETALQPTSGQRARSRGVTAPRHAELATRAGSSYFGFALLQASCGLESWKCI